MDIFEILNRLEEVIETGSTIPFSGKVGIDKGELLDLVDGLRREIPEEIREATYIQEEKESIIREANKEAGVILNRAKDESKKLLDENYIMQLANEKGEQLVRDANEESAKIRQGARNYADEVLQNTQENLSDVIRIINENRQQLKN